jgi:DNA-binding response OmpR family regulator
MSSVILLIDDDPILGPVTIELLQTLGHRADWVESYERGFETLSNPHDITLVLLDLQLGPQRGEDLVCALRDDGIFVPPIIVFSAQPMAELRKAADVTRASAILQKPCGTQAINNAITAAVSARG